MQYKIRYRPIELLGRDGWHRLSAERHDALIARAAGAPRVPRDAASPAKDASLPQFDFTE
jgi:arginine-tRNA-protein transferase